MNNSKDALIIFARKPEIGKVKTRLAAGIGAQNALKIYILLLQHTRAISEHLACGKFVFVTAHNDDDFWPGFNIELQQEGDLGERMRHAFTLLFQQKYERIIIIGTSLHIEEAFTSLWQNDIVLGPTLDGGYYLLGMNTMHKNLFINKSWSTPQVFAQTMEVIGSNKLSCKLLGQLTDVDEADDVPVDWMNKL
jgi:rSAM/selenodomain-associated transferase 1